MATKPTIAKNPFSLIQRNPQKWNGLVKNVNGFLYFDSFRNGIRAGYINLYNTYLKAGYNTLATIFPKYAPASAGNNPINYMNTVANEIGIGINEPLKTGEQIFNLGLAISRVESGSNFGGTLINDWYNGYNDATQSTLLPPLKKKLV
jgi:hypothetical protein